MLHTPALVVVGHCSLVTCYTGYLCRKSTQKWRRSIRYTEQEFCVSMKRTNWTWMNLIVKHGHRQNAIALDNCSAVCMWVPIIRRTGLNPMLAASWVNFLGDEWRCSSYIITNIWNPNWNHTCFTYMWLALFQFGSLIEYASALFHNLDQPGS